MIQAVNAYVLPEGEKGDRYNALFQKIDKKYRPDSTASLNQFGTQITVIYRHMRHRLSPVPSIPISTLPIFHSPFFLFPYIIASPKNLYSFFLALFSPPRSASCGLLRKSGSLKLIIGRRISFDCLTDSTVDADR